MISKHLGNILDITHDLGDHIWDGKDPSVFRMMLLKDFRGTQRAAACAMTHDRILNRMPSFDVPTNTEGPIDWPARSFGGGMMVRWNDSGDIQPPTLLRDLEVGDTFRFLGESSINTVVTDTDDVGCIGYEDEDTYYHEIPVSNAVIKLKTGE
tara:strand:- start:390 stop:848 length:459 start_codon:yes stop_codon:yes gene_type:complete